MAQIYKKIIVKPLLIVGLNDINSDSYINLSFTKNTYLYEKFNKAKILNFYESIRKYGIFNSFDYTDFIWIETKLKFI